MSEDLSSFSMIDLFRSECESQTRVLSDGLVQLEGREPDAKLLESLMRAAHSLKGAARIVDLDGAVSVSHAMEDTFVAAQAGKRPLDSVAVDHMLRGVDLLTRLAASGSSVPANLEADVRAFLQWNPDSAEEKPLHSPADQTSASTDERRALRVTAENLDRLLGSAGESLVASRRLRTFTKNFWQMHRHHRTMAKGIEAAQQASMAGHDVNPLLRKLQSLTEEGDRLVLRELAEFERFERAGSQLAERLYEQALTCRMRPFSELAPMLRRTARDTAKMLGREVSIEIRGESTEVDREMLEKLEAPLVHLIRNAIDHGIEAPDERTLNGKTRSGQILIEASHHAGFLIIRVADDGSGVDTESLRSRVVSRNFTDLVTAARLTREELLEFLFLPGFSIRNEVTETSGRGVGLDIVQSVVRQAQGSVKIASEPGHGVEFVLQLPISLSVIRALLFEVAGEPYALPLARVDRAMRVGQDEFESIEGRPYFKLDGARIGVVDAASVLGRPGVSDATASYFLVLGDQSKKFGVMVSRFLGECEIVVQPLDPNLGKVRNIAATALMEDGSPLLLIDYADFFLSIERLVKDGAVATPLVVGNREVSATRRILVVDDSLTVRELERKLLTSLGYHVEIAVDGLDAWNAARQGNFSVIVTDVDMPRMDGIELTHKLKADSRLRDTPVIIVSYKDRDEDRRRGLDAGADYYLTKASFQDEGLARAIADVLGEEAILP